MRRVWVALGLVACDPGGASDPFGTADWSADWSSLEDRVLELVNQRRSRGGSCGQGAPFAPSSPLVSDDLLRGLARDYSRRMAEEQFFDHVDPEGADPFDRMEAAGFGGALPWGENIAAGYTTADEVVDAWMNSPGHCANVLEPTYGALGVGYYERLDDPAGAIYYWTQEFAGSPQP